MKDINATFVEKLYECNKHKQKLLALKSIFQKGLLPIDLKGYSELSFEESSYIDQMVFRFSKFQDTMGEKLFPALLELLGEEVKSRSFIDRLNRIEELELLYKDEWLQLRKDRNEVAHEYSFNQEEIVDGINLIYKDIDKIILIYDTFYAYCNEKFEFVKNSPILKKSE